MATTATFCYHEESYCRTVTILLIYHAKPCHIILKDSVHTDGVNFPAIPELYWQQRQTLRQP